MNTTYPIAAVGELIGEPARAAILIALLDGKARTAGELALTADVSAQSASAHLSKLVDGGLLTASRTGRHRYYAMAGPDVAHALEAKSPAETFDAARSGKIHNRFSFAIEDQVYESTSRASAITFSNPAAPFCIRYSSGSTPSGNDAMPISTSFVKYSSTERSTAIFPAASAATPSASAATAQSPSV